MNSSNKKRKFEEITGLLNKAPLEGPVLSQRWANNKLRPTEEEIFKSSNSKI